MGGWGARKAALFGGSVADSGPVGTALLVVNLDGASWSTKSNVSHYWNMEGQSKLGQKAPRGSRKQEWGEHKSSSECDAPPPFLAFGFEPPQPIVNDD